MKKVLALALAFEADDVLLPAEAASASRGG